MHCRPEHSCSGFHVVDNRVTRIAGAEFKRLNLHRESRLGIAVSGGGDSLALMTLLVNWKHPEMSLEAVSIDHGLRPEAADECARAAALASSLDIIHKTIRLDPGGWTGNLQAAARKFRYESIANWASERGIGTVALGHTRTDQAETVLMNLARGSGVNGLSAMPAVKHRHGVKWVRPLLELGRSELREYLVSRSIGWDDDPSNDENAYLRIRVRNFLLGSNDLGLTEECLSLTARHMQNARTVIDRLTAEAISSLVTLNGIGEYRIDHGFSDLDEVIRFRLLGRLVKHVSGECYHRRFRALSNCLDAYDSDGISTIGGCLLLAADNGMIIVRDHHRCERSEPSDRLWDGRWKVEVPGCFKGAVIGPLGMNEAKNRTWASAAGYTHRGLAATPAVWHEGRLVASFPDNGNAGISFVYWRKLSDLLHCPGSH